MFAIESVKMWHFVAVIVLLIHPNQNPVKHADCWHMSSSGYSFCYLVIKRIPNVPGPQWQDTVQPALVS